MSFAIELSTEISHRNDFALLCNARDYKVAVEVGVEQGINARNFLAQWDGDLLVLVDPYGDDMMIQAMIAVQALMPFYGRFRFEEWRSPMVVPRIVHHHGKPHFVYIDGDHTQDGVAADLAGWWPAVADGGMLAGHDYINLGHPGVRPAVDQFAREHDLTVRLTHELQPGFASRPLVSTGRDPWVQGAPTIPGESPSWYIYKGGEPERLHTHLFRRGTADDVRAGMPVDG